jgi:hypothetical protein
VKFIGLFTDALGSLSVGLATWGHQNRSQSVNSYSDPIVQETLSGPFRVNFVFEI